MVFILWHFLGIEKCCQPQKYYYGWTRIVNIVFFISCCRWQQTELQTVRHILFLSHSLVPIYGQFGSRTFLSGSHKNSKNIGLLLPNCIMLFFQKFSILLILWYKSTFFRFKNITPLQKDGPKQRKNTKMILNSIINWPWSLSRLMTT